MNENLSKLSRIAFRPGVIIRNIRYWVVAALVSSIALLAAYQVPYTYSVDLGNPIDARFLAGFQEIEADPGLNFRWTTANSSVSFPGIVQNQNYQLSIRLAAGPRPSDAPSPEVTILANGAMLKALEVRKGLRTIVMNISPQMVGRGPDLLVNISSQTFVPSKTIPSSTDDRNLGVIIDHIELAPTGAPIGSIALPPLNQWLGWLLAAWLWLALIIRTGWAPNSVARFVILVTGVLVFALGLVVARPWVTMVVWYACATLAFACIAARPFANWIAEFKATRRIPFGFIHTLGISDSRVRLIAELVIILVLSINYLTSVVLPLRYQVLGDFYVYYAGANVWLNSGNPYDQNQLQMFNQARHILDGQIGPFTSPPSALLFFAPFAVLPLADAKAAWLIFGFVLLAASGLFLWLAVRASVSHPASPIWLALMFSASQSLEHSFDFGQVNTLYSFLFAFGLWAWTKRRTALTGAGMAVGAAVKVFSGIFIPYFLLKRAWRALAASVIVGAVLGIVSAIFTGAQTWLVYIVQVLPEASAHRVSSFDQSLLVFLRRTNFLIGLVPDNDQLDKTPSLGMSLVALGLTVAVIAVTAYWFSHFVQQDDLHEQLEFALVIVVMMLVLPRMWEHYLMWLILPFFLILTYIANRPVPFVAQLVLLLLLGVSWIISQDGADLFTRPGWPTWLISLGLYGILLIFLCLLYLSALAPALSSASNRDPQMERAIETRPQEV